MMKIGHALNVPVPACIYWQHCDGHHVPLYLYTDSTRSNTPYT